ncbi:MAG: serine hydrolase, partial [Limnobacter sp.]|nr:serine hydrolase [Limnobacter sp.]
MFKSGLHGFSSRFMQTALVALGALTFSAHSLAGQVPPPEIGAKGYLLLDLTTGQTLADHNSTEQLEPASLTKLMTAYMTFSAVKNKQISMDQVVPVST